MTKIKLFTDLGVDILNRSLTCGIIITDRSVKEEIKCKLPKVESTGATTAKSLSVSAGMYILFQAGFRGEVNVYNDNEKVIETVNSKLSFKDVVGENR